MKTIKNGVAEISQETDSQPIIAYVFGMVDDYFATNFFGLTKNSCLIHATENELNVNKILSLIWEGQTNAIYPANPLYDYVHQLTKTMQNDDDYESLRKIYENQLINALKFCYEKGIFVKHKANNAIAFAFYSDDFEDNQIFEKSLIKL